MDEALFDDEYETCHATYVSLRITGGESHPSSVSAFLGLEPTVMRVRGETKVWLRGGWREKGERPGARSNHWGLWTQEIVCSRDSRRHVHYLLSLLAGKQDVWAELRRQGWKGEMVVFWDSKWGHGGPSVDPAAMRQLGELDIPLCFDVYFSEPDRAPEEVEGHPGLFRIGV